MATIEYYIKAKVETKSTGIIQSIKKAFTGLKCKFPLSVSGSLAQENILNHQKVVNFQDSKNFTFSRSKGILSVHGSIPTSIFTPGDFIPVTLHIKNESSKRVNGYELKLEERCKVKTREVRTTHSKTIQKHAHKFTEEISIKNPTADCDFDLLIPQNTHETAKGKLFSRTFEVGFLFYITREFY